MGHNSKVESELAQARAELSSIIKEIDTIADEITKFKGVGAEKCASALRRKSSSLNAALKKLNRVSSESEVEKIIKNAGKALKI